MNGSGFIEQAMDVIFGSRPKVGPTRVMGIVNVTPDSFSDGGRSADVEAAVAHGLMLVEHRRKTSNQLLERSRARFGQW